MTRLSQRVMPSALIARGLAALALGLTLGLSIVASPALAQPAAHCLSVQSAGNRTVLKNVCPGPISVALCATDPKQSNSLMARPCGDGSPLNQYYTVPIELAPGESSTDEIVNPKTVVCNGPGAATGMGGFTSDANGNFKCPSRPVSARLNTPGAATASPNKDAFPDRIVASTTESQDRACTLARNGFKGAAISYEPCECTSKPGKKATFHVCSAAGKLADPTLYQQIRQGAIDLLQELMECDPKSDDRVCERMRRTNGGSGVRG
jgi:hypothetical protein